jgi:predicted peptidase
MIKVAKLLLLIIILLDITYVKGQLQIIHQQKKISSKKIPYLLYLPEGYSKDSIGKFPLILFLHGIGESGNDLQNLIKQSLPKAIEEGLKIPFIVVSPQCKSFHWWSTESLKKFLDEIILNIHPDTSRIYLTGNSMGGYASWALAIRYPEMFAAVAPVCGGGNPREVYKIKDIPTWAFHGAKDIVVPLSKSRRMVKALREAGGNVTFTVYPEEGHHCWRLVYNTPALYEWFLANTKDQMSNVQTKK